MRLRGLNYVSLWIVLFLSTSLYAFDHSDSESVTADPSTDIADLYAWINDEKLVLIMTLNPDAGETATFSDEAQYVFHVRSQAEYNAEDDDRTTVQIICTFKSAQQVACTTGSDSANGDASETAGLESGGGTFRVFAGRRSDPAFFNKEGFDDAADYIRVNLSEFETEASGCPVFDAQANTTILSRLQATEEGVEDAVNTYAGQAVLALVVEINVDEVNKSGTLVSVHATTHSTATE